MQSCCEHILKRLGTISYSHHIMSYTLKTTLANHIWCFDTLWLARVVLRELSELWTIWLCTCLRSVWFHWFGKGSPILLPVRRLLQKCVVVAATLVWVSVLLLFVVYGSDNCCSVVRIVHFVVLAPPSQLPVPPPLCRKCPCWLFLVYSCLMPMFPWGQCTKRQTG